MEFEFCRYPFRNCTSHRINGIGNGNIEHQNHKSEHKNENLNGDPSLDITDVRQFLSDMHTEINALTTNAYESIVEQRSSQQDKYCSSSSNIKKEEIHEKHLEQEDLKQTVSVEETIVINSNSNKIEDEDIIEIGKCILKI